MKFTLLLLLAVLVGYASAQCITCGGSISVTVVDAPGAYGNAYPAFVYIPGDSLNKHCMICQIGNYTSCNLVPTASTGNGCTGTTCHYPVGWSSTYVVHPDCPDTTNCGTGVCPSSCTGAQCKAASNVSYSFPAYADVLCHCGSKREESAVPVDPKQVAEVCPNGYMQAPLYVGQNHVTSPVGDCPNYPNSPWNLAGDSNPPCAICQQGWYTSRAEGTWSSQQYPCSSCHNANLIDGTIACITHLSPDSCYCAQPPTGSMDNSPSPPVSVGEPIGPGCGLRDAQKRNRTTATPCRREGQDANEKGGSGSSPVLEERQNNPETLYSGPICATWYPSATVNCIVTTYPNYQLAQPADCDAGIAVSPAAACGGHDCSGVSC